MQQPREFGNQDAPASLLGERRPSRQVAPEPALHTIPAPPDRSPYYPSSDDWRREFIYFLMPDRFSDSKNKLARPDMLTPEEMMNPSTIDRTTLPTGQLTTWMWDFWAVSGRNRFQGGTIEGITHKLDYIADLGITVIWLAPVFCQRDMGVNVNECRDATDDPYFKPDLTVLRDGVSAPNYWNVQYPRDDYHGYSVQDFLEVDPRFGTKEDLRMLVEKAHHRGIRVVFDIVINHATECFAYDVTGVLPPLRPPYPPMDSVTQPGAPGYVEPRYGFGGWLDANGKAMATDDRSLESGVWPEQLRSPDAFNRKGLGDYGNGPFDEYNAQFRESDYINRDFYYPPNPAVPEEWRDFDRTIDPVAAEQTIERSTVLEAMVAIWKYWIAETDCDGFRVDTFKHVPKLVGAAFVRHIREYATSIGKDNFLVMCEIGGMDAQAATYLEIPDLHVLELGERRQALRELAGGDTSQDLAAAADAVLQPTAAGLTRPADLNDFSADDAAFLNQLSKQDLRNRVVMSIDDHDGLGLDKLQRLAGRYGHQSVLPAVALLLYGYGTPCLYHGTEQAMSGPVGDDALGHLGGFGIGVRQQGGDRYLREAMFGPIFPRKAGRAGWVDSDSSDENLPGFGPMGTCGRHVFNRDSPWYRGVSAMGKLRRNYPALATGDIYAVLTTGRIDDGRFGVDLPGTLVAWLRRDAVTGGTALIAINSSTGTIPHSFELALPQNLVGAHFDQRLQLSGYQDPNVIETPINVVQRPQTEEPYLALGTMQPGEVRVLLERCTYSPLPTA